MGVLLYEVEGGDFSMWWCMGLLVVPSCGYWGIGCYGFGSSGELFLGFYLWVFRCVRVEV